MLTREGVTVSPEAKEHVWTALTSLASAPAAERTLTGLSVLLQSGALKRALQPIVWAGLTAGCSMPRSSTSAVPTCRRSRPKG